MGAVLTPARPGTVRKYGGATVDHAIARWHGVDGRNLQNSGVILDDANNITGVVGLSMTANLVLSDTTLNVLGVVMKGADRFIHNFHHPSGGSALPVGQNTFVGVNAGNFTMGSTASTTAQGSNNTAMGYGSFTSNTLGHSNSAFGSTALAANTTGVENIAVGYRALVTNTVGSYNTATGVSALAANTSGASNVAFGWSALTTNTTGSFNLAMGVGSLGLNTTGSYNTAVGYVALAKHTTADHNTAMGAYSLFENTTGSNNIGVGSFALRWNTTGANNTAVGYAAGMNAAVGVNQTSFESVYIGAGTKSSADGIQNEIVIGYGAIGQGAHTATLGHTTILNTYIRGHTHLANVAGQNTIVGNQAALATTATDGFLYVPTCAGTPTGVPTSYTGKVALVFDTTNNRLYAYDGGWLAVELAS